MLNSPPLHLLCPARPAGRLLRQFQFPVFPDFPSFPTVPTVTTTTPTGTLTTGTFTSGPGSSASSSSSTSGSGGTTFQTSTSQGGSTPVTVTGGRYAGCLHWGSSTLNEELLAFEAL